MTLPTYTPYDGSAKPFTIGLMPLDPSRWIEPDEELGRYLTEKQHLLAGHREEIFVAGSDTDAAQQECLELLVDHLCNQHSDIYQRRGNMIDVLDHLVDLSDPTPPLLKAGSLIADDLVLMRRKEAGWHLVAGHVAFPSSWSLREKFARPLQAIHADVPGFSEGTRNATLITRIFDNLQVTQPVERLNWSINRTDDLFLPVSKHSLPEAPSSFSLSERFVRVERQTLRKLPVSGDIVFTIRVYVDPIAALKHHPEASRLAVAFADQIGALTDDQLGYKNLHSQRDRLVFLLRELAMTASPA
ncbi:MULTISPECIES: DUF3445 domain-containing protein [unclassified Sinorhizobium]|uniref:heme-dependent oxidative N-demethylase family protein n=1 Tax=unclassified Sinorhizobium TaxID=2613772 RepID=UPI003523708E